MPTRLLVPLLTVRLLPGRGARQAERQIRRREGIVVGQFLRQDVLDAAACIVGEPEVLEGYGRRNTTLLAIAPTTSSAFILGQVSQGIEHRARQAQDTQRQQVGYQQRASQLWCDIFLPP